MKLAVIFPGIGYHTDKPLLYYGKKLAKNAGFEILEISYNNFPKDIKGNQEKMKQAFCNALEQTERILTKVEFTKYNKLLFISKSIGTAVAAAYTKEHHLHTYNVFYTPVEESFTYIEQDGIVFHGTKDPWVKTEIVKRKCEERSLPLYITEGANHSLETGDVIADIENMEKIMRQTDDYFKTLG